MINKNRNSGVKKIPFKGLPERQEKETICSNCTRNRPYANKTKKLCGPCVNLLNQEKIKVKKAKVRQVKSETITQRKLDEMTSWLVRAGYDAKCHACGAVPRSKKTDRITLQCCHFVSRRYLILRFDLINLLPGCMECNMFNPHHVWPLGKYINSLWGKDTTENLLQQANVRMKMNNNVRKQIYDLYKDTLNQIETKSLSVEQRFELLQDCRNQYLEIVKPMILP